MHIVRNLWLTICSAVAGVGSLSIGYLSARGGNPYGSTLACAWILACFLTWRWGHWLTGSTVSLNVPQSSRQWVLGSVLSVVLCYVSGFWYPSFAAKVRAAAHAAILEGAAQTLPKRLDPNTTWVSVGSDWTTLKFYYQMDPGFVQVTREEAAVVLRKGAVTDEVCGVILPYLKSGVTVELSYNAVEWGNLPVMVSLTLRDCTEM